MSTPPRDRAAQTELAGYLEAMETEGAPLLGHLVLYSIFDSSVTRDQLEGWFAELDLDAMFLPPPLRDVDAFERVTGAAGVRVSYPLGDAGGRRRRRRPGQVLDQVATLMVRHVRRDGRHIVRHLVREVRDEHETRLSYDVRLGECVFTRSTDPDGPAGAGMLTVAPDHGAIRELPPAEQRQVQALLEQIESAYTRHCTFLGADRLRATVRSYIEHLNAVRVRPTGGVYFVHRRHAGVLAGLRELVSRLGGGSHLVRVPIPDQDEMREMVVQAFRERTRDDLDRLARDIVETRSAGAAENAIATLHRRFTDLKAATAEHAQLLNTSLDDTNASLQLVQAQLASLLVAAGAGD
ncbi:MAG TPA: DUF6744 family protein [Candidatus Dormibacteraeota bacterium]|jgi:hypothetical protein